MPALEELLGTLLYEGYALYPYTPGATKNATPTPFGIVYPPAYAQATPEHVRQAAHAGHRARRRRRGADRRGALPAGRGVDPPGGAAPPRGARAARSPSWRPSRTSSPSSTARLHGRVRMSADDLGDGPLARDALRAQHDGGGRGPRPRRGAGVEPALHAPGPAARRRALRLAAARRRGGRESVNTFPVLATDGRRRAARRGDHAARPSAAGAREPRRPLRRHRDRGGAAAARPRALRRRARGDRRGRPGRARDGRARRRRDARGHHAPCTGARCCPIRAPPHAEPPGRARGRGRRRHLPAAATRSCCASAIAATPTTASSTAASPRSSASTTTTRTSSTSA